MASQNKGLSAPGKRTVWAEASLVCMLDQRLLPHQEVILRLVSYPETIHAIKDMAVRGAGTIGVTAGYAMAQAALAAPAQDFWKKVEQAAQEIRAARPTAKNLFYAVDRVLLAIQEDQNIEKARERAQVEAKAIDEEDAHLTQLIAEHGAKLIPPKQAVMTHCNAGWLAYGTWGSALAPIYMAHAQGRNVFVYATETRPRSQGAKLTTWELTQAGVPNALVADTAAGYLMSKAEVGLIIVGADRIAANGDTANKIGTYGLAVMAQAHKIPFYIAAPAPTFDADCPSGAQIPIEERDESEVTDVHGALDGKHASVRVATPGVRAKNPAFDVTPARLLAGFITECGIVEPNLNAIAAYLKEAVKFRSPRARGLVPTK